MHFHYALYFYDVLSRGVLATEDANLARFAAYTSTWMNRRETLPAVAGDADVTMPQSRK